MRQPAKDSGAAGVAGFIAYQTDVLTPDCSQCGFSGTKLEFWRTDKAVLNPDQAQAIVDAAPPGVTVQADKRYEQPLEPGWFLACTANGACAGLEVFAGHVTTLNVLETYGPGAFNIFDPVSKQWFHVTPFLVSMT